MIKIYRLVMLVLIFTCTTSYAQDTVITQKKSRKEEKKEKKNSESCKPELETKYGICPDCDPDVLIYDFKSKHFFYNKKWVKNLNQVSAKYNQEFKLKVININRYMYDVNFSADNIDFGSDPPALFNKLFLGIGGALSNIVDTTQKTSESPLTFGTEMFLFDDPKAIPFKDALLAFMAKYYGLIDDQLEAFKYCPQEFLCCGAKDQKKFSDYANAYLQLKISYQEYVEALIKKSIEVQKKIEPMQKALTECKKTSDDLEANLKKETDETKKSAIKKQIQALGCENLKTTLDPLTQEKALNDSLKANMDRLWASITKITDENLMKLVLFDDNLVAEQFSYTSPPIYPKGNKLSIGLKISPADSGLIKKWNIMPLYNDSLGLDIFVKGKWFVSFSSGPFLGIGNRLRNETYASQAQLDVNGVISDSSQYKLVPTGQGNQPIGFAAFANIGVKLSSGFGLGLSPGVGLTVEDNPRPFYFLGGSLFFGEKHQFNITGGVSLTQVDQLKKDLYTNIGTTLYASAPTDLQYSKKLQNGWFISVSYTLFSFDRSRNSGR